MGISEKTIISPEEILEFIPQRSPIVMVDEFFGIDGDTSVSGFTVRPGNMFVEEDILSECGVIEHMAQSAALRVGYICKSEGREVPIGFIGAINNFVVHSLPDIGDRLRTRIRVEQELMNITLILAEVTSGGRPVAECKMKIYLQE